MAFSLKNAVSNKWTVEAMVLIFFALMIRLLPMSTWSFLLGTQGRCSVPTNSEEDYRKASSIARTVKAVGDHLPLKVVCLPRAIATHIMLRRRGISSTMLIGVRTGDEGSSSGLHAWVNIGPYPLLREDVRGYIVASAFS